MIILGFNISYAKKDIPIVEVHYLGHSSFVISFDNGVNLVTDYGNKNAWKEWGWDSPILDLGDLIPDIMTFSHFHKDHYDSTRIPIGVQHILTGTDTITFKGIKITHVRTCEENVNIESNTSFIFEYKGFKICHLGDAQAEIANIGDSTVSENINDKFHERFDLLLMTIGGKTQFIKQAEEFIRLLNPRCFIPMHYWSEQYLHEFLRYFEEKNRIDLTYYFENFDKAKYYIYKNKKFEKIKVITLIREPFYNNN